VVTSKGDMRFCRKMFIGGLSWQTTSGNVYHTCYWRHAVDVQFLFLYLTFDGFQCFDTVSWVTGGLSAQVYNLLQQF